MSIISLLQGFLYIHAVELIIFVHWLERGPLMSSSVFQLTVLLCAAANLGQDCLEREIFNLNGKYRGLKKVKDTLFSVLPVEGHWKRHKMTTKRHIAAKNGGRMAAETYKEVQRMYDWWRRTFKCEFFHTFSLILQTNSLLYNLSPAVSKPARVHKWLIFLANSLHKLTELTEHVNHHNWHFKTSHKH